MRLSIFFEQFFPTVLFQGSFGAWGPLIFHIGFPGGAVVKDLPASAEGAGDLGLIPGSERSLGVENGNPL